jgi:hypothetical protein
MDTIFGIRNVRRLHAVAGSLKTIACELAKYVRNSGSTRGQWDKGVIEIIMYFSMEIEMLNIT